MRASRVARSSPAGWPRRSTGRRCAVRPRAGRSGRSARRRPAPTMPAQSANSRPSASGRSHPRSSVQPASTSPIGCGSRSSGCGRRTPPRCAPGSDAAERRRRVRRERAPGALRAPLPTRTSQDRPGCPQNQRVVHRTLWTSVCPGSLPGRIRHVRHPGRRRPSRSASATGHRPVPDVEPRAGEFRRDVARHRRGDDRLLRLGRDAGPAARGGRCRVRRTRRRARAPGRRRTDGRRAAARRCPAAARARPTSPRRGWRSRAPAASRCRARGRRGAGRPG